MSHATFEYAKTAHRNRQRSNHEHHWNEHKIMLPRDRQPQRVSRKAERTDIHRVRTQRKNNRAKHRALMVPIMKQRLIQLRDLRLKREQTQEPLQPRPTTQSAAEE